MREDPVQMATGAVPATFSGLETRDPSLGFARSMDFVRVSYLWRLKSLERKSQLEGISNPVQGCAHFRRKRSYRYLHVLFCGGNKKSTPVFLCWRKNK